MKRSAFLKTAACSPASDPATANYNAANRVTWTTVNSAVNGPVAHTSRYCVWTLDALILLVWGEAAAQVKMNADDARHS